MSWYKFARGLLSFYFHVFNRLIIRGKENEVPDGPLILFGNHYCISDVFLLGICTRRQVRFMAKHTLFDVPVIGSVCKAFGAFPVNREKTDLSAVKTALRILKNGEVLGIFPEGTRVHDGKTADAKGGIAMFAWKTGATLQPVHLTYRRRVHFFNHIEVTIGKPIQASELGIVSGTSEEFKEVSERLLEQVYSL